jgi:hypothetical protein
MTPVIGIPLALVSLGLLGWAFWRAARSYWKLHGRRIVTCPETGLPAAVDLAMWRAAVTGVFKGSTLQLRDCSRWRERALCTQPCLRQIEAAPEEFLVLTILSKWYRGRTCTCCGRSVGRFTRWGHKPCLMTPDLRMLEWKDIRTEDIPRMLATHAPVCRTCLLAETHTS